MQKTKCSRPNCKNDAIITVSFDYKTKTLVCGPIIDVISSSTLFLCEKHKQTFNAPIGWKVFNNTRG
jgi:hypothetical protein